MVLQVYILLWTGEPKPPGSSLSASACHFHTLVFWWEQDKVSMIAADLLLIKLNPKLFPLGCCFGLGPGDFLLAPRL
jgi:hypothetical protein